MSQTDMGQMEADELKSVITAMTPEQKKIALSCYTSDELVSELHTRFKEYETMLRNVQSALSLM